MNDTDARELRRRIVAAIVAGDLLDNLRDPPGDAPAPEVAAHEAQVAALIRGERIARDHLIKLLSPLAGPGGVVAYALPDGTLVTYVNAHADRLCIAPPDRVRRLED